MADKPLRKQLGKAYDRAAPDGPDLYTQLLAVIAAYDREFQSWEKRVDKIVKRYKDESRPRGTQDNAHFNILWSNVQTLVPACFSKLPRPDVSRRFRDQDDVGRVASLLLERSLDFEIQHYPDYRQTMSQSVHDRFLGGRGTCWARYEPHFKAVKVDSGLEDGVQVSDDTDEAPPEDELDYECAPTDYVYWRDFGHDVARTWEEVTKVWRWVYMDEEAVRKRFGEEIAKSLPYDSSPASLDNSMRQAQESQRKQAKVCELWDKSSGMAYWFTKGHKGFIDEREDPLELQEFFPCPRPLFATITNDSLVPVPDFSLYQDQAKELDILADRIDGLAKMLQVKGVYDGSADASLARLFTEGENGTLMPVKNWAAFAEKGGLTGQVDIMDLKPIYEAFNAAVMGMKAIKEDIYEITGISDIVRGQTEASETATAQQIKGQYASLRLRFMQDGVAQYATDILRLKAQIICSKFSPQTILMMSAAEQLKPQDQQLLPQALALLIGEERLQDPKAESPNPLRSFRIEVAADTLVQLDEQAEKQDRMEMLAAIAGYFEKMLPVAQASPALVPLIVELGKFGIQAFKVGKGIEGAFDAALDKLQQEAEQRASQPPPPNPELEAVQAKSQAEIQKAQMSVQVEQQKAQIEGQRMQMEQQHDVRQQQIDQQGQQQDMEMQQQQGTMQMEQAKQANAMKAEQAAAMHAQKMRQAAQTPARKPQ